MIRLKVWANDNALGWFGHEAGEYFFQYDPEWLKSDLKFVISPQFNLRPEAFKGDAVKTFLPTYCQKVLRLMKSCNRFKCAMPPALK